MTLSELMSHLRCAVLRDTALPQLWTDSELLRYLNDAESLFCRRTHCITDDTSDFTTFDTVVGQDTYTLDKRIIAIDEAGIVLNPDEEHASYHPLRDNTRGQQLVTFRSGRPVCFTLQARSNAIRFSPVPDDVYKVTMVVARKPLRRLVHEKDQPEIAEEYQLALCDYAAWKALTNNDPEGANMSVGTNFQASWLLAIRDAKRDLRRTRSGPYPQARANWTGKRLRY